MDIKLYKSDIIDFVISEHYNDMDFIEDLINESLNIQNKYELLKKIKEDLFFDLLNEFKKTMEVMLNNIKDQKKMIFSPYLKLIFLNKSKKYMVMTLKKLNKHMLMHQNMLILKAILFIV